MLGRHFHATGLFGLVVAATLVIGTAGCGSSPGTDLGSEDVIVDIPEEDTYVAVQKITFLTPDPSSRVLVSGTTRVEFDYSDTSDMPATVTVSMVRNTTFQPIVIEADGSGRYSTDVDTTTLLEGNESVLVTIVSSDQRKVSAKGKILVDNIGPKVEVLEPTPLSGGSFIGSLAIRVKVTDEGNKVHNVNVSLNDFEWSWPEEAGTTAEIVDTRTVVTGDDGETYEDLVVPISGWKGGPLVMKITADDGVDGHDVVVDYPLTLVEVPGFVCGEDLALPDTSMMLDKIAGIRLGAASVGDGVLSAPRVRPSWPWFASRKAYPRPCPRSSRTVAAPSSSMTWISSMAPMTSWRSAVPPTHAGSS